MIKVEVTEAELRTVIAGLAYDIVSSAEDIECNCRQTRGKSAMDYGEIAGNTERMTMCIGRLNDIMKSWEAQRHE